MGRVNRLYGISTLENRIFFRPCFGFCCRNVLMDEQSFHLEEYKMLREEIMQDIREIYRTETLAAIAVVSVYTWLLTHRQEVAVHIAWFIPPCVIVVCMLRCLDLTLRINAIGQYLKQMEEVVFKDKAPVFGWEHYKGARRWIDRSSSIIATGVWVLVLIVSIITSCKLS